MTEQERQEIENLLSEECAEDDFIIGGKIQTLDQYLKRYWIWKNREIFAPDFDYECKENIVDILKSKEDISDNRFEKIVDLRDYRKGPKISNPLRSLNDLREMLEGKLNAVIGEITLPSGKVVKGYDFLICKSEECRGMLLEKKITEYDDKSCPLTVKNRSFFTWILNGGIPFRKEKSIKGFISRMQKTGIMYEEDRVLHIMINEGLASLAYNPQLLFTGNMMLKRLEEIFPYDYVIFQGVAGGNKTFLNERKHFQAVRRFGAQHAYKSDYYNTGAMTIRLGNVIENNGVNSVYDGYILASDGTAYNVRVNAPNGYYQPGNTYDDLNPVLIKLGYTNSLGVYVEENFAYLLAPDCSYADLEELSNLANEAIGAQMKYPNDVNNMYRNTYNAYPLSKVWNFYTRSWS